MKSKQIIPTAVFTIKKVSTLLLLLLSLSASNALAQSFPWTVECLGELSYTAENGEVIPSGSIAVDYQNIYQGDKYIIAIANIYFKNGKKRKFVQINKANGRIDKMADAETQYQFSIANDNDALYIPAFTSLSAPSKSVLKIIRLDKNTMTFTDFFSSENSPAFSFIAESGGKVAAAGISLKYKLLVFNYASKNEKDNDGYMFNYDTKTLKQFENKTLSWYFSDTIEIYNYKKGKATGLIDCATMKESEVDNSIYQGHPYTTAAPRLFDLNTYTVENGNMASSGSGTRIALKKGDVKVMEMYVKNDVVLTIMDTIQKIVYYYKSTAREVSLSGYPMERKLLANNYINVLKKLKNTTDEDLRRELRYDSVVLLNSIYKTYAKSYDYDKPQVYVDESGTMCFYEEFARTTSISEYLDYAIKMPSKVDPSDFTNKFHDYEMRASRDMIKQLKTIPVNRPMKTIDKPVDKGAELIASFGADKNIVYTFRENVFYKIDNKTKKVTAYQPIEVKAKHVIRISADTYMVMMPFKYQLVDMSNGLVISETMLPKPYIGLGSIEFQTDGSGNMGKMYNSASKCFMYFNIKTQQPIAYFDESYDHVANGQVRKKALKGADTFYFSTAQDYPKGDAIYLNSNWSLQYNGNFVSPEIGDSTYRYSAKYIRNNDLNHIADFAESVEAFGFFNAHKNRYEVFDGPTSDLVPKEIKGLWSADLDNGTFPSEPPTYEVYDIHAERTRWPKPKEEIVKKEETPGAKVCAFCDGKAITATKRCQNNCMNGKVYETVQEVNNKVRGMLIYKPIKKEFNCRECGGTGKWVCRHCKGTGVEQ